MEFGDLFPECVVPAASKVTPFAGMKPTDRLLTVDGETIDGIPDAAILAVVEKNAHRRDMTFAFARDISVETTMKKAIAETSCSAWAFQILKADADVLLGGQAEEKYFFLGTDGMLRANGTSIPVPKSTLHFFLTVCVVRSNHSCLKRQKCFLIFF